MAHPMSRPTAVVSIVSWLAQASESHLTAATLGSQQGHSGLGRRTLLECDIAETCS